MSDYEKIAKENGYWVEEYIAFWTVNHNKKAKKFVYYSHNNWYLPYGYYKTEHQYKLWSDTVCQFSRYPLDCHIINAL